jgi:hypothetical protein
MVAASRDGAGQDSGAEWRAVPARPTVGDTVWLERRFPLAAGWRLRPGRLDGAPDIEGLGEPSMYRTGDDWTVRYPVAAWTPGPHTVSIPPIWRLGPDAQADSVLGGTASFVVQRVIPDTATTPAPRPALEPLRGERRDPKPVLVAIAGAAASLAAALWWRRRRPRRLAPPPAGSPRPEIADARWLDAGESRAVAARAAGRLRVALAAAVPDAHLGLSTAACLAAAQRARPQGFPELATVLDALDQVAFATGSQAEVARLADRARTLAGGLER